MYQQVVFAQDMVCSPSVHLITIFLDLYKNMQFYFVLHIFYSVGGWRGGMCQESVMERQFRIYFGEKKVFV